MVLRYACVECNRLHGITEERIQDRKGRGKEIHSCQVESREDDKWSTALIELTSTGSLHCYISGLGGPYTIPKKVLPECREGEIAYIECLKYVHETDELFHHAEVEKLDDPRTGVRRVPRSGPEDGGRGTRNETEQRRARCPGELL